MFGVMKAQGISSYYLSWSIVAQTFILALIGTALGFAFTLVSGAFLPAAVPVSFDLTVMVFYGFILMAVATAGAFFSVLTIVRIDPQKAIGGENREYPSIIWNNMRINNQTYRNFSCPLPFLRN